MDLTYSGIIKLFKLDKLPIVKGKIPFSFAYFTDVLKGHIIIQLGDNDGGGKDDNVRIYYKSNENKPLIKINANDNNPDNAIHNFGPIEITDYKPDVDNNKANGRYRIKNPIEFNYNKKQDIGVGLKKYIKEEDYDVIVKGGRVVRFFKTEEEGSFVLDGSNMANVNQHAQLNINYGRVDMISLIKEFEEVSKKDDITLFFNMFDYSREDIPSYVRTFIPDMPVIDTNQPLATISSITLSDGQPKPTFTIVTTAFSTESKSESKDDGMILNYVYKEQEPELRKQLKRLNDSKILDYIYELSSSSDASITFTIRESNKNKDVTPKEGGSKPEKKYTITDDGEAIGKFRLVNNSHYKIGKDNIRVIHIEYANTKGVQHLKESVETDKFISSEDYLRMANSLPSEIKINKSVFKKYQKGDTITKRKNIVYFVDQDILYTEWGLPIEIIAKTQKYLSSEKYFLYNNDPTGKQLPAILIKNLSSDKLEISNIYYDRFNYADTLTDEEQNMQQSYKKNVDGFVDLLIKKGGAKHIRYFVSDKELKFEIRKAISKDDKLKKKLENDISKNKERIKTLTDEIEKLNVDGQVIRKTKLDQKEKLKKKLEMTNIKIKRHIRNLNKVVPIVDGTINL